MTQIDREALENRIHMILVPYQNDIKPSLLAEIENDISGAIDLSII